MSLPLLPDLALGTLLLIMAWGAMYAPARASAMSLFIAFGVVMALIWARLGAPDLALAEAAIGAGLTGTLFIQASLRAPAQAQPPLFNRSFLLALVFVIAASLWFVLYLLGSEGRTLLTEADLSADYRYTPALTRLVEQNMPISGVTHPVTAVLLNFRVWDTVLELLVLLLALLGVRQLYPSVNQQRRTGAPEPVEENIPVPDAWPLARTWAATLAPVLLVTGTYLLWRGAEAAGGAFQAGALLAAGAVLLRLTGLLPPLRWSSLLLRVCILAGAAGFLSVAIGTALAGDGWLHYPPGLAKPLILITEILATVSIAVTLSLLVVGERTELR